MTDQELINVANVRLKLFSALNTVIATAEFAGAPTEIYTNACRARDAAQRWYVEAYNAAIPAFDREAKK